MPAVYHLHASGNVEYFFRLTAENDLSLFFSKIYASKSDALEGIQAVIFTCLLERYYTRQRSPDGMFYFSLVAANGEELGVSQMYATEISRDAAIARMTRLGPTAAIKDHTGAPSSTTSANR